MDELRCANIGIAVGAIIAVVGVLFFRNAGEAVLQLVGAVSFITTFVVYFTLQGRADRQKEKDSQ